MKISLYKKLKLYNQYIKIINENRDKLTSPSLNLRIDRAHRLYTVINMNDDVKTYGTSLSEKYIKDYISNVDTVFNKIGLGELVGILDGKTLDETNYLVVFGFSLMNTAKFWTRISVISVLLILTILGIIIF